MAGAGAGAGAGAEIMAKVVAEPEPKINNFGSATLVIIVSQKNVSFLN